MTFCHSIQIKYSGHSTLKYEIDKNLNYCKQMGRYVVEFGGKNETLIWFQVVKNHILLKVTPSQWFSCLNFLLHTSYPTHFHGQNIHTTLSSSLSWTASGDRKLTISQWIILANFDHLKGFILWWTAKVFSNFPTIVLVSSGQQDKFKTFYYLTVLKVFENGYYVPELSPF